jgi:CarD family transcriptional regulator
MSFEVGDRVVHWAHGPGEIIQIDEKELSGLRQVYYVVQIRELTLWVPVNGGNEKSLRYPTPADDFERLFKILSGPAEALSEDRMERKTRLSDLLKDGKLELVCQVIRDLTHHGRVKKMNDYDNAILERARNFLLEEWCMALAVPLPHATLQLQELLTQKYLTAN